MGVGDQWEQNELNLKVCVVSPTNDQNNHKK